MGQIKDRIAGLPKHVWEWAQGNTRAAGMIGLSVVLLGVMVYVYMPRSHEITVFHRIRSDWGGAAIFNLDNEYAIRSVEIRVIDDEGEPGDVMWRLEEGIPEGRDPEREVAKPRDTLIYGRRLPGMKKTSEGRPPRLERGKTYRLDIIADRGRASYEFVYEPPERRRS